MTQKNNALETLTNKFGSKKVTFKRGVNGIATSFLQVVSTGIDAELNLIELKFFKTEKQAIKWANKQLRTA